MSEPRANPLEPTGISGLDSILGGGLPGQRLYLVHGEPGTGKTTLLLQFLLAGVARGQLGMYISLSETREEILEVARSHGWSLDGIEVLDVSTFDALMTSRGENTLFHPAEIEFQEVISEVMTRVARVQPRRLAFDSLLEMRLLAGDSLRYRRQLVAIKAQLMQLGATVLFTDDRPLEGTSGDQQLVGLASGVIALRSKSAAFGGVKRELEVLKLRAVQYRTGRHDFRVERGGLVVYPRIATKEQAPPDTPMVAIKSGSPELDALLGGGLTTRTSTLLIGPAGVGKSSVASMYIHAALGRGEKVAVFSFDENERTFFARLVGQGMPLQEAHRAGQLLLQQIDPAELSPGEFIHAVTATVMAGCRMLLIDSLNGYLSAMPDAVGLVGQMHELLTYLSNAGCSTLLTVAQTGLIGSMQSPVDLTYLADTVLLFRFFEAHGSLHRALSVVKKRTGAHEAAIRELRFTSSGARIGAPLQQFSGVLTGTPVYGGSGADLAGARS